MNYALLIGRITKDTEIKVTPNGKHVTSFSIAVQRNYKNADGGYDTDFINCVAFGTTADFIHNNFQKGQLINVVGPIQTRTWNDAQNQKRYATEIVVKEVNFCGGKTSGGGPDSFGDGNANRFVPVEQGEDDLPF